MRPLQREPHPSRLPTPVGGRIDPTENIYLFLFINFRVERGNFVGFGGSKTSI